MEKKLNNKYNNKDLLLLLSTQPFTQQTPFFSYLLTVFSKNKMERCKQHLMIIMDIHYFHRF